MKSFTDFFAAATALGAPYPYQEQLATGAWPDVLNIATGMGKTAGVTLAWLYRRRVLREDMPRRLIWCLPMRVLAEQTKASIETWLESLGLQTDSDGNGVSVHLLMGGEPDLRTADWASHPEEDAILIGTQDMLLSRALMRGYCMSRYQWPMHFALLHNDALWVFDEVQLMGPALRTTSQLEAFRRDLKLAARPSRSLWVSATLDTAWLGSVDFRPHIDTLRINSLEQDDLADTNVRKRINATKRLQPARTRLTSDNVKQKAAEYASGLTSEVTDTHQARTNTLVIVNNVERAQAIYQALAKRGDDIDLLLLHARFRPAERREIEQHLRQAPPDAGRIVVATQAIEAGVDITSTRLFTELSPWPSLVQRFGRCNRYGETMGAAVYWIDIEDDPKVALPYEAEQLELARSKLNACESASSTDLPPVDAKNDVGLVLRRKDFLGLFNTDTDLSGADINISPYIRDQGTPQLQVFWRNLSDTPPDGEPKPQREELCPVSLGQFDAKKQSPRIWDTLQDKWLPLRGNPIPGMTLMLDARDGGYDTALGYFSTSKKVVADLRPEAEQQPEIFGGDRLSQAAKRVRLTQHLDNVVREIREICAALGEDNYAELLTTACRWHDVGKAHEIFRATLNACLQEDDAKREQFWAKSECNGKHSRPGFRHELASALAWLTHNQADPNCDLVAYLIAAHHGRVRMGLRAMPNEKEPDEPGRLFARGIWDGDTLPALDLGEGIVAAESTLRLGIMQLGEGPQGSSWAARSQQLLRDYGPFRLAWLETLVRLADWRASGKEQEDGACREQEDGA